MSYKPKPYVPSTEINDPNIRRFVVAMCGKDKRKFRRDEKYFIAIAKTIKSEHLPFICKVFENPLITIQNVWESGNAVHDASVAPATSGNELRNLAATVVSFDFFHPHESFAHEAGHAIDSYFGYWNAFSTEVILNGSQSLWDILEAELDEKEDDIYNAIIDEYETAVAKDLGYDTVSLIRSKIDLYKKLVSLPVNLEDKKTTAIRRSIQAKLYECGFVEAYYEVYRQKHFQEINRKYLPILDALSSRNDFNGLFLSHHEFDYYQDDDRRSGREFFANMFAAKVQGDGTFETFLSQYMPRSLEAFETLFGLISDHIMNDKPFSDITLRREIKEEE